MRQRRAKAEEKPKSPDELKEDLKSDLRDAKIEMIHDDYRQDQQRVAALVDGREDPANDVVAYLVDQMREVLTETKVGHQQLAETNRRANQLQQRLIELRGVQNRYVRDILSWQTKEEEESNG